MRFIVGGRISKNIGIGVALRSQEVVDGLGPAIFLVLGAVFVFIITFSDMSLSLRIVVLFAAVVFLALINNGIKESKAKALVAAYLKDLAHEYSETVEKYQGVTSESAKLRRSKIVIEALHAMNGAGYDQEIQAEVENEIERWESISKVIFLETPMNRVDKHQYTRDVKLELRALKDSMYVIHKHKITERDMVNAGVKTGINNIKDRAMVLGWKPLGETKSVT